MTLVNTHKIDKRKTVAWLVENFPAAFFDDRRQVTPLKLGIFEDILEFYDRLDTPPFSKKALREALNYYSSSPAYLTAQKPHTARIDLFGNEVDTVTEEQATYARRRYQEQYQTKKS